MQGHSPWVRANPDVYVLLECQPANPGSMVCQRDQREGGTSKPWVHGVPERGWDQQTLGLWCARGTRERVGPANPGSMLSVVKAGSIFFTGDKP